MNGSENQQPSSDELVEEFKDYLAEYWDSDRDSTPIPDTARDLAEIVRDAGWKSPAEVEAIEKASHEAGEKKGYDKGFR